MDIHNGLSNNQIECIFKDSKGFMWFGTTSGLNRYDSYQFKVFRHDANDSSSIDNDYVLSIQEMPDGKLLIETRDWLNVYDPDTERFSHNLPNYFQQFSLPTAKILNLQKNSKGDSYFLMENNGLETGANDYMTKPFNFDILLSKIKNQLNQQQQAKTTYQKQVTVNTSEVKTASQEDKFMQDILVLIEKNMSEPDFSIEDMSKEMYMSRVALYKKLLQFTGKSPLEFLRQVRLKRAAQLLEKTNMTVAEVAYEVGFNNPKYFSKYFKAEFDKLPSVYAEEMRRVEEG